MKKKEEASTEADAEGDGDKKRSAEDMKEKVSLHCSMFGGVCVRVCVVCRGVSASFAHHGALLDDRQSQPLSKRQRVKEKEKRRKDRHTLGKDKLCFAIAEGRTCPHGDIK
jgi:hypothetical protein